MIGEPLKTEQDGYRHLAVKDTPSTNTLCLDYAASGEEGNLWITAEQQSSGKGSRGREWTSQTGNLFASLLISDPCEKHRLVDLTFIAAISVREAIEVYNVANHDIKTKWPNDVMLNNRKCSGILLESVHYQDASYVVMGIGVNCQNFPSETLHKATSLYAEGIEVSKNVFFLTLANKVSKNISFWSRGENFAVIRQKWLDHAYKLGEQITVHIPGQEKIDGTFASIDDNGYMLLEMETGEIKQISTADIFFKQDP